MQNWKDVTKTDLKAVEGEDQFQTVMSTVKRIRIL
jgi:hypothetical protein